MPHHTPIRLITKPEPIIWLDAAREAAIRQCIAELIAAAAAVGADHAEVSALHAAERALLDALGLEPTRP